MTTQGAQTVFKYDDLGQIIAENNETFGCDSHYNRRLHNEEPQTIDDLNQLIGAEGVSYTYDLCGNVETKTTASEVFLFSYDPLDRLIDVKKSDGSEYIYTYDPLHRRISKTGCGKTTRYLYEGQNEIGIESDDHFSLRILGDTPHAEIGSSIALEIDGKAYIPLHDLQGSMVGLLDPQAQTLREECAYTAFGAKSSPSQINPWGYLSKGIDPETGLVFFGRRYYDPAIGRWMTTDPKGYTDSMNLYAFALNDPFLLVDPYGLENEIATAALSGAGHGAAQGFLHPIDSYSSLCGDLSGLVNCSLIMNFSYYSSSWQSMTREDLIHLVSFKAGQIGGFAAAVAMAAPARMYALGRTALHGAGMLAGEARAAFSYIGSRYFSRGATEFSLSMPASQYRYRAGSQTAQAFRPFTERYYRENLVRWTGRDPGKAYQAHHVFPQQFEKQFTRAGINIHEPKYLTWWHINDHLKNAKNYNKMWGSFLGKASRSEDEILHFGRNLMSEYGIPIGY